MKQFMTDLGVVPSALNPITLFCDNTGAIALAKEPRFHKKTRHIKRRFNLIRDYVEGEDIYRHSKWLAFMERRLKLARELLNPNDSVLIVTIDEKEYLRLGLLLEQTFPEARIQMISIMINPAGVSRAGNFARIDEYAFFVSFGKSQVSRVTLGDEWRINPSDKRTTKLLWSMLNRTGTNARRLDRPNLFYPIYLNSLSTRIVRVGDPIPLETSREEIKASSNEITVWPIRSDGSEGNWQISPQALVNSLKKGYVRVGRPRGDKTSISYLKSGEQAKIETGVFPVTGRREDGSVISDHSLQEFIPGTAWKVSAHDSSRHGSNLLRVMMPDRKFPFPKSLYAVEDALRFFISDKPNAIVLDFFAGSGTTAHAVMRLNAQDGGQRQSISITNNEVSADEQRSLRKQGLRPGDADWEALGICDYITKPRIRAAITGVTPDGEQIKGDYKFTDEFPLAEGFKENVEFFTLTYESPWRVARGRAFDVVAPLLWMRAGSQGRRIEQIPPSGWDVADMYGVIADLDQTGPFLEVLACAERVRVVFIVTDDDRAFQSVCAALPEHVEPVRLYESYLRNFEITGRE